MCGECAGLALAIGKVRAIHLFFLATRDRYQNI